MITRKRKQFKQQKSPLIGSATDNPRQTNVVCTIIRLAYTNYLCSVPNLSKHSL